MHPSWPGSTSKRCDHQDELETNPAEATPIATTALTGARKRMQLCTSTSTSFCPRRSVTKIANETSALTSQERRWKRRWKRRRGKVKGRMEVHPCSAVEGSTDHGEGENVCTLQFAWVAVAETSPHHLVCTCLSSWQCWHPGILLLSEETAFGVHRYFP